MNSITSIILAMLVVRMDCLGALIKNLPKRERVTMPGTKWCGGGDIAEHIDDLGLYDDVDLCCRDHDLCPYNIPPFKTKDNYWNIRPHTVSHCNCDSKFFDCLKSVKKNKKVAYTVGFAYFNTARPPCVVKEHGTYCSKYHWMNLWCEETTDGEAAIPYDFLAGRWQSSSSVQEIMEEITTPTPIAPKLGPKFMRL